MGYLPGPVDSGGTCPGCTQGKGGCWEGKPGSSIKTCYVSNLLNCYPAVSKLLTHNTIELNQSTVERKAELLIEAFKVFELTCDKRAKRDGCSPADLKYFRLYWSGDIDSLGTAMALMSAVAKFPSITFWLYTRTLDIVHLLTAANLVIYISVDPVNKELALAKYEELKDKMALQLSYLSKEKPKIKGIEFKPCPVDSGKLALEYGCKNCKLCYTGHNHVWFKER